MTRKNGRHYQKDLESVPEFRIGYRIKDPKTREVVKMQYFDVPRMFKNKETVAKHSNNLLFGELGNYVDLVQEAVVADGLFGYKVIENGERLVDVDGKPLNGLGLDVLMIEEREIKENIDMFGE